ncbi:TPA: hypothetical protein DEP90_03025 [Patescibacteria group bacterium]|nr:hypothetical protein [Patescibacteria group bacterium]
MTKETIVIPKEESKKKGNTLILILIGILILFISIGVGYFLGYGDKLSISDIIFGDEDNIVTEDMEDTDEEDSTDTNIEETIEYNYSYLAEAIEYEPDSDKYWGFRVCDYANSTCTVYGIDKTQIAEVILGQEYNIYFNEYGGGGAGCGTTYYEVTGDVLIK